MNDGGRGVARAIPLALAATALTATGAPASAESVTIVVTELRSGKGVVRACMTRMKDVFPRCIRDPQSHRTVVAAGGTTGVPVAIRFDGVQPGKYAIALLHDENDNGKADRALGMMPKEGYGFSRDAEVRMGPPDWQDAVFEHGSSAQDLTIRMRYFL